MFIAFAAVGAPFIADLSSYRSTRPLTSGPVTIHLRSADSSSVSIIATLLPLIGALSSSYAWSIARAENSLLDLWMTKAFCETPWPLLDIFDQVTSYRGDEMGSIAHKANCYSQSKALVLNSPHPNKLIRLNMVTFMSSTRFQKWHCNLSFLRCSPNSLYKIMKKT